LAWELSVSLIKSNSNMMKMNLLAGLACVALLSACSSQRVTAGDGTAGSAATSAQASTPTQGAAVSNQTSDQEMLKPANMPATQTGMQVK
jgi:hypothetical protein